MTPCDTSFKARRLEISLLAYLLTYIGYKHFITQTPSS